TRCGADTGRHSTISTRTWSTRSNARRTRTSTRPTFGATDRARIQRKHRRTAARSSPTLARRPTTGGPRRVDSPPCFADRRPYTEEPTNRVDGPRRVAACLLAVSITGVDAG